MDAVVEEAADVMLLDPLSVTRLLSKSPVSVHGDKKLRIAASAMQECVASL